MAPSEQSVSQEGIIPVSDLVKRLRPLVNASCNLDNGESGESCLKGTPLIALHRATVTAILQHLTDAAADEGLAALLRELARHTNWELTYGGWEDEEQLWKVHSVNGGRNDREWTLLGTGDTPAEAIAAALDSRGQA